MMTSLSRDRRDFTSAALLRNPHVMTVFPGRWPRRALLAGVPTESRLFTTEPHTQLPGFCHWLPHRTASRMFNRSLLVVDEPLNRELDAWLRSSLFWSAAGCSVLSNILPRGFLGLHETLRTGGVREREFVRIHAMGLAIRLRRDPELTPRGQPSIVSNEVAATTDGEQRRCDECLPPRSGRRVTSGPYHGFINRHKIPSLLACGWGGVRYRPVRSNRYAGRLR